MDLYKTGCPEEKKIMTMFKLFHMPETRNPCFFTVKKRFAVFPSPAEMSLTKLFLAGII
jgi:hypothetical protein